MTQQQQIKLLDTQLAKITALEEKEDHEAFNSWHTQTELLLKKFFGKDADEVGQFHFRDGKSSVVVGGRPDINAQRHTEAYFRDITQLRSQLTGIRDFLKDTADDESEAKPVSTGTLDALHDAIKQKCSSLYLGGHYPEAVEKGFKVVRDRLRELTTFEKGLEAFGRGRLHINGATAPNVEQDFQDAVKFLTASIDFFRNEKSHTSDGKIDDPVRAYEYLSLSSLAMHLLDDAEVRTREEKPPKPLKPNKPAEAKTETERVLTLDPLQVFALRLYAAMPTHKELIISRTSGGNIVHPMDTVDSPELLEGFKSLDVQEFEVNLDEMYEWGLVTVEYGRNNKRFKLAKAGYNALKELPDVSTERAK